MGWTYNPETDEIDYYEAGVTDHGGLTGLGDDDHTQYLLAAGSRALTGSWDAGSFEIRAQTFQSDVAAGTAPFVVASNTLVSNLNADLWDGYQFADYLDQAVKQASSPVFVTVKLSGLTDGYAPYHVSDVSGLGNTNLWTDGANFGLAVGSSAGRLEIEDGGTAQALLVKITQDDENVYGLVIGNDTHSTTDLNGITIKQKNSGQGYIELEPAAAWSDLMNVIQVGGLSSIWSQMSTAVNSNWGFSNNAYYTAAGWRYQTTGEKVCLTFNSGGDYIQYGASATGNAGDLIGASLLPVFCARVNTGKAEVSIGANATISASGWYILGLYGAAGLYTGPNFGAYITADAYPVFQGFFNNHDYVSLNFDCYYGGSWLSSDAGSSYRIIKYSDMLHIQGGQAAAGAATTFYTGFAVDILGNCIIGAGTTLGVATVARLEIEDGATAKSILLKITQDDANVYGLIIGNDAYSTTDTLGLRLSLGNTGSAIVENSGALDLYLRAIGTANASDVYVQAEDSIYFQDYSGGTPVTKGTFDLINGRLGIGMAPAAGLLQVGDGTNYSEVEADGTLKFAGTATVWKDINLGAAQLGQPASGAPSAEKWVDEAAGDTGIYTLAFALNEYVSGSFEMQHDYKEGSDITFHVHYGGITAPAGGTDNVKWELTYTIARDGNTINAATVITAEAAFTVQYRLERINFTAITGSTGGVDGGNIKIGDQFLFKLKRVAASADDYAGDAYLATAGLHYEIDTVGSRTIAAK